MTGNGDDLAELYDAFGYIARHLLDASRILRAIDQGLPPAELANALGELGRHVTRAYDAAATVREQWAP